MTSTPITNDRVWKWGRDSYWSGAAISANPFQKCGDGYHSSWNDGWEYAHALDQKDASETEKRKRNGEQYARLSETDGK